MRSGLFCFKPILMTKEYELQLTAWQKGEDYTEGLRLWKQRYGENIGYKMLCMGAHDFNREKLRVGLCEGVGHGEKGMEEPKPDEPKPVPKKVGKVARLEETVDELESELWDVTGAVDDVKDTVDNLGRNVENLEGSVMDLAEKVEQFMAKVPPFDRSGGRSAQPDKVTSAESRRQNIENEPEEVRNWHKLTYGLMDERVLLKQRLRDLPDPERREARKEAAYRILDITAELDRLFGKIGYWEQHGRVPSDDLPENAGILYPKRYLNLRTYISRQRKKISKTKDPVVIAGLEAKIKEYEQEMTQIEIDL